jgi:hypothetical protein
MKRSLFFLLAVCISFANPVSAQKGTILKKVAKSMADELLGKSGGSSSSSSNQQPEPSCACSQAQVAMDIGGKLKLDYKELSISVLSDGRILAQHRGSDEYYIVKDGVTQGPYKSGDPRLDDFAAVTDEDDKSTEAFIKRNKPYISRSGEKLLITFNGKTYGPYASIENFTVSKSKDKFAAFCIETMAATEDDQKKMEEAMKNAKTDQEKMDLAMEYGQQMQQKLMDAGGTESIMPKLVTNIPDATYDPMKNVGGSLNGKIKYDDILVIAYDKIIDLQGKTIMTIKPELLGSDVIFVNSSNTKYAVGGYGNLTFSDKTVLSDLFNPYLLKEDGKIYLAYMYYSPKKNSIMQCKIPF